MDLESKVNSGERISARRTLGEKIMIIGSSILIGVTALIGVIAIDYTLSGRMYKEFMRPVANAQEEGVADGKIKTRTVYDRMKNQKISDQFQMERYFPLGVGNTWTYTRTPRQDFVFNFTDPIIKEPWPTVGPNGGPYPKGPVIVTKRVKSLQPSEEIYTITGMENDFWNVKIIGNDLRDGRYVSKDGVANATWGYIKSNVYGQGVQEIRACSTSMFSEDGIESRTWLAILFPESVLVSRGNPPLWQRGVTHFDETIIVPTKNFFGCIEYIEMINGYNLKEVLFEKALPRYPEGEKQSFMTQSFFAEDVGLVKEVQYDKENRITYTLELKSFNVK